MSRLLIDVSCPECHTTVEDVFVTDKQFPLCVCGHVTERVWLAGSAQGVIGDDIPGGRWISHGKGIINEDGSPKRYDSKSAIAKAAKAAGWRQDVRHIGDNPGTDKSKHTTRWV